MGALAFLLGASPATALAGPLPAADAPPSGRPAGKASAAGTDEAAPDDLPLAGSGHAPGAAAPTGTSEDGPEASLAPAIDEGAATANTGRLPSRDCLARTICAVKNRIRWQSAAWTPATCQSVADDLLTAAKTHDISPTLLLAIMINESDMNEHAVRLTYKDAKVYAKDSGLMAIRCVVDKHDRCTNGYVRGMAWKKIMEPSTNIELGAAELARWRQGGGVIRKTFRARMPDGHIQTVTRDVPCHHKTHGFWAHYNHGPRYIDHGSARHYPQRVAVLDHAMATILGTDAPELHTEHLTVRDPGKRERTADRPVEARYKKLYGQILSSAGSCPTYAEHKTRQATQLVSAGLTTGN